MEYKIPILIEYLSHLKSFPFNKKEGIAQACKKEASQEGRD